MSDDGSKLVAALAEVQAKLPKIVKGETAEVPTKAGGKYSYTYADLASISEALLPLLAEHGMAFTACPHLREDGQFVLRYSLMHASGEERGGDYPLTLQGGPQAQGSAITYARRYVLCAVTGVAPDDDDGQAAQAAATTPADPLTEQWEALLASMPADRRKVVEKEFSDATGADPYRDFASGPDDLKRSWIAHAEGVQAA